MPFKYLLVIPFICLRFLVHAADITVGLSPHPTAMEQYAAKELCRYVHLLTGELARISQSDATNDFIVGRRGHHPLIDQLIKEGELNITASNPGPQGYLIKKLKQKNSIVIAANDEEGVLYGVYGFLEEHLGVSFHFDGDVLPPAKLTNIFSDVDEVKTPAVAIRGFLPWTNFPQSATSYSWEDWKFILDQAAKMRLNFIQIHNYNGEEGHNEMFHNFEVNGKLSRVWMATAKTGHAWGSYPGWDVNKYCFGSSALFDDYDFGADCALHNEGLDNRQVFRKAVNEFQRVIAYAHQRGIKIGLGLDINLIPDSYHLQPGDPKVVAARVKQIRNDYPDLDYLLCFQSESLGQPGADKERKEWRTIFDGFYYGLKKDLPHLRFAVAGWGIRAEDVATLPADVICAPISYYSDGCESGAVYGNREYWGCPWLQRDFNSSVYYYPYNMDISNTIKAWQGRASNMKGFYALTWVITDAIKAKIGYLAKAAWDDKNELSSSGAVYKKFAVQQYGEKAANLVTSIINQNEPFASNFSECRWTPPFALTSVERTKREPSFPDSALLKTQEQLAKANQQLLVIDSAISQAEMAGQKYRLGLLKSRIAAEHDHIILNMYAPNRSRDIAALCRSWVANFNSRVTDISSLGNVVSMQNRFIQKNYRDLGWKQLNTYLALAPEDLEAKGTLGGTKLYWKTDDKRIQGFYIYRDGKKITPQLLPGSVRDFEDKINGDHVYEVHPVKWGNDAEQPSTSVPCQGGKADKTPAQIVLISPPTSVIAGQPLDIKARLLDNRDNALLHATLYYRYAKDSDWKQLVLTRKTKAIFVASLVARSDFIEYYIAATDGTNTSVFPADAPSQPLSATVESITNRLIPGAPHLKTKAKTLEWQSIAGAYYYRIYRSKQASFECEPATFLTYMAADAALTFTDNGVDLSDKPLKGRWYYRIIAVSKQELEGKPSNIIYIIFS